MTPTATTPDVHELLAALGVEHESSGAFAGRWLPTGGERIESLNPATGEVLGAVTAATADDWEEVAATAEAAFAEWRTWPAPRRGEVVRQLGQALREHKEELGRLVTLEAGKILSEGLGEVQEMIDMADLAVGMSRQLYGLSMHSERPLHRMYEQWHPLGPVGIVTAFNFPVAVWAWNACVAAVAGDSMVWKPSSQVPLTAVAVTRIAHRVLEANGAPPIFGLLVAGRQVGAKMVADPRFPLISATGSVAMGREIGRTVADRLGRSLLELGGNNGIVVTDDADLDLALRAIVFAAVGTAGQRCTTTRRLFLQRGIAAEMKRRLVDAYGSIPVGDPAEPGTLMGPLINEKAVGDMMRALDTVREQGGRVLYGGGRLDRPGFFVEPTLVEAAPHMPITCEETFAPILYLFEFDDSRRGDRPAQRGAPGSVVGHLHPQPAPRRALPRRHRQRLRHRQRQHRHLRGRDRRRLRRREGDRRRPRGGLGLLEGLHAAADLHPELGHRPAARPGGDLRGRRRRGRGGRGQRGRRIAAARMRREDRRRRRRRRPRLLLAAAALLAVSCFDPPVREELDLDFAADGSVAVSFRAEISAYHLEKGDAELQLRLRRTQEMLLNGWDAWPSRFDRAAPDEESFTWRKSDGELLAVERTARLTEPTALERFFSDVVTVVYTPGPERSELAFYPTSSARATAGERQLVARRLDSWSAAVARYLAATARLYGYLALHPERARPTLDEVFGASDDDLPLLDREEPLVAALRDGVDAVTAVLEVAPHEATTLDELSQRVYDPFPARLRVTVPGRVLEAEGFRPTDEGGFEVGGRGLWAALESLQGRWVAPDPAAAWVAQNRSGGHRVTVDELLAGGLRAGPPPDADEVRQALEDALGPAPVVRLAWRAP